MEILFPLGYGNIIEGLSTERAVKLASEPIRQAVGVKKMATNCVLDLELFSGLLDRGMFRNDRVIND